MQNYCKYVILREGIHTQIHYLFFYISHVGIKSNPILARFVEPIVLPTIGLLDVFASE